MVLELKDGNFVAFPNYRKSESDPDFKGWITVDGVKRDVSFWIESDELFSGYIEGTGEYERAEFKAPVNIKMKDSWPDYRGEFTDNGIRKHIVIWIKLDKNKKQFLSGAFNLLTSKNLKK